ncbi:uncharacterized protein MELLADRAFT_107594 [Melampsora larici-populina 98AG31]|uniref:RWD domain-containing protein n=1 Tax=Melampsora larici-populina (strain 98AG31 / pathotype 3-4-7) TaxID=747676 RepID=F4RQ54_MELLP|nr:uncharacterized protein MELLADRAFT_107594 [Melampsora larici-populina 98AG31]EGG05351.1 hypothetical protein MELLADRAFT_107594 [Melampsora larici-populina 98AG31]
MEEELEVLTVIFDEADFQVKHDPPGFLMRVSPEEPSDSDPLEVDLDLTPQDGYPTTIPLIEISDRIGKLDDFEKELLINKLTTIANESVGDAMGYTLYTELRQELGRVLIDRESARKKREEDELRAAEEQEKNRAKGTPVNKETFMIWRTKFNETIKLQQKKIEDEKLKSLTPKERDEFKNRLNKFTGRQLFESNKALVNSDASLLEPDAEEIDLSSFEKALDDIPSNGDNQET